MASDPALDAPAIIDTDYVRCFEAMAAVEVMIRRRGPSPHLLLRRAMLLLAIGNVAPALEAARRAVALAPREGEAHFQEGCAWLGLARVQCGGIGAPGATLPARRPLMVMIQRAYEAFCAAWTCSAADTEAGAQAQRLEAWLMMDEATVARILQGV